MQKVDNNVPGAPYYLPGKYIPNANNYLHSPPGVSGGPELVGWISNQDAGIQIGGHEAFDHLHYFVGPSGSDPTKAEMSEAPYIRTESSMVLALPEGESYVWFLEHNETHHPKGTESDVGVIGPLQVDLSGPIGSIRVAGGLIRISDEQTFVQIEATDDLSGVSGVYIDGDVVNGPNVRSWLPYSGQYDIELTPNFETKTVNIRFRDFAGNLSALYLDTIFLGETKYYFYNTDSLIDNQLKSSGVTLVGKSDNQMQSGGSKMTEGDEHGEFGDS